MRFLMILVIQALLVGCAVTYQAPAEQDQVYSTEHHSTQRDVLSSARRALLIDGFQIQSSDDSAGFISTAHKNWKLTPEQANCGQTLGLDYLKDKRTKTAVAFNVIVDDKTLMVRSNIQGEYKPGSADQDITLTCISRGVIEAELGQKIVK